MLYCEQPHQNMLGNGVFFFPKDKDSSDEDSNCLKYLFGDLFGNFYTLNIIASIVGVQISVLSMSV